MNYNKIYLDLILKAKNRNIETIKDQFPNKHHIKPKHKSGGNEDSNMAVLTYKEHIFAHKLLYQIYHDLYDKYAYQLMESKTKEAARTFRVMGGRTSGENRLKSGRWDEIRMQGTATNSIRQAELAGACSGYRNKYIYIDHNDDTEYYLQKSLADKYKLHPGLIKSRCQFGNCGLGRRLKTKEELKYSEEQITRLKSEYKEETKRLK